ncbi:MAG TPA: DCC1-like thiol-disulfide oxidoreductase family protein [Candidatus Dormibacteraeota bacterium]|nr:DCC1-like thiol-disulfide oxidoreductase family protein [Candidatus Dormibacteraeota bacterium]
MVLIYDDACSRCRRVAAIVSRLDRRHRVRLEPIRGDRRLPGGRRLACADLLRAVHLVDRHHRVFSGFAAARRLAWELPPLWPALPLLYLPGASRAGAGLYRLASAGRGRRGACPGDGPAGGRTAP